MITIREAETLCDIIHANHIDKQGKPFKNHPKAVANRLRRLLVPDWLIVAALFHDSLESKACTIDMLVNSGVDRTTLNIIIALTRSVDTTYRQYIDDLIINDDCCALLVKLADNLENYKNELRPLPVTNKQLNKRYGWARNRLLSALANSARFQANNLLTLMDSSIPDEDITCIYSNINGGSWYTDTGTWEKNYNLSVLHLTPKDSVTISNEMLPMSSETGEQIVIRAITYMSAEMISLVSPDMKKKLFTAKNREVFKEQDN